MNEHSRLRRRGNDDIPQTQFLTIRSCKVPNARSRRHSPAGCCTDDVDVSANSARPRTAHSVARRSVLRLTRRCRARACDVQRHRLAGLRQIARSVFSSGSNQTRFPRGDEPQLHKPAPSRSSTKSKQRARRDRDPSNQA